MRFLRLPAALLAVAFLLGSVFMLTHALSVDRQADTQLVSYSFELLSALKAKTFLSFFLELRKYPLLPVLGFSGLFGSISAVLLLIGTVPSTDALIGYVITNPDIYFLAMRLVFFVAALGTLFLAYRISKKFHGAKAGWCAIALLLTSFLFSLYSTSMRPHMLVTFWMMLTLSLSLDAKRGERSILWAWLAATAAFCTLQNGFFAILFPLWASLSSGPQRFSNRCYGCLKWLILFGVLSLLLGYPFLLNSLSSGHAVTFDRGHEYLPGQPHWTGAGFVSLFTTLVFSEPAIAVASAIALLLDVRRWSAVSSERKMLWLFILVYCAVFGLYAGTSPRMFLPILPMLAVLSAGDIASRRFLTALVLVFAFLLQAKTAMLGFEPDTYDHAKNFLMERKGAIATDLPRSYFGIPPTKASIVEPRSTQESYYKNLEADLPDARSLLPISKAADAETVIVPLGFAFSNPAFKECLTLQSAPDNPFFLWAEMPRPVVDFWTMERLGPELSIYCKK